MARFGSDRGAALIHVAVVLIGLFLFSAFVVDYGTFWVARGQAQNAADSAALAGAVTRLYDDTTNPPASTTTGKVPESVFAAAAKNYVWGVSPPSNTVNISYNCPDGTTNCVAVDVYRDGTNNSATLPTFFLKLVNVDSQGTKAHAVAEAVAANSTGCMRPWFLPNQGWVTPDDFGQTVILHEDGTPGAFFQLAVDNIGQGNGITPAIEHCSSIGGKTTFTIGDTLTVNNKPGVTGGPEAQGVDQLIKWDPNATVTGTGASAKVSGGCAVQTGGCMCDGTSVSNCPNGATTSPRVVVVALCDPNDANCAAGGGGNSQITISNFLAFFINGCMEAGVLDTSGCKVDNNHVLVNATLVSTAGLFLAGGSPVGNESFLKAIVLVR